MEKENVKEQIKEQFNGLKAKISEKEDTNVKKIKPLVTSRVLFISVLDKIYLIVLAIMLVSFTYNIFSGDISSISYNFWTRFLYEILALVGLFITYLFLNWFYQCAVKTVLCLTDKQVYKEAYIPFKRTETSIPLNKITRVSTINVFWIFRSIVIHQYGKFPVIFFTWNNQEFKDKLNELIVLEKNKVQNEYENKNIINKEQYKYLKYVGLALALIIALIAVIRFFSYMFGSERRIAGTYSYKDASIVLEKDGSCEMNEVLTKTVKSCEWSYISDTKKVVLYYETSSWYSDRDSMALDYDKSDKTLKYLNTVFTKK